MLCLFMIYFNSLEHSLSIMYILVLLSIDFDILCIFRNASRIVAARFPLAQPPHETGPGGFPRPGGAATDGRILQLRLYIRWEFTLAVPAKEEAGFELMETWQQLSVMHF